MRNHHALTNKQIRKKLNGAVTTASAPAAPMLFIFKRLICIAELALDCLNPRAIQQCFAAKSSALRLNGSISNKFIDIVSCVCTHYIPIFNFSPFSIDKLSIIFFVVALNHIHSVCHSCSKSKVQRDCKSDLNFI